MWCRYSLPLHTFKKVHALTLAIRIDVACYHPHVRKYMHLPTLKDIDPVDNGVECSKREYATNRSDMTTED